MLTIQLSQDQLKNPKVLSAYKALITEILKPVPTKLSAKPKLSKKKRPKAHTKELALTPQEIDLLLDETIVERYQVLTKAPKSLYFLGLVKKYGSISSDSSFAYLRRAFPQVCDKRTVSGISGSLCRAFKKQGAHFKAPYVHTQDASGNTLFVWQDED